jgi:hypothetical protein
MKVEDVGSPQRGPRRASCWPTFVLLPPLLCLLCVALTLLAGFT